MLPMDNHLASRCSSLSLLCTLRRRPISTSLLELICPLSTTDSVQLVFSPFPVLPTAVIGGRQVSRYLSIHLKVQNKPKRKRAPPAFPTVRSHKSHATCLVLFKI